MHELTLYVTDGDEVQAQPMIALEKNPPMVSPAGACVADLTGEWRVAHTRSRHEKALATDLLMHEIPYFLPMLERTVVIRKRQFRSKLPMFSGYLFFVGDTDACYQAMSTSRIANLIPVVDQAKLVDEMTQIQRALETPTGFDPYPCLRKGTRCRITRGPLRGVEGVVIQRGGITRLVLQIEMLGQAISTEIDPSFLEQLS